MARTPSLKGSQMLAKLEASTTTLNFMTEQNSALQKDVNLAEKRYQEAFRDQARM